MSLTWPSQRVAAALADGTVMVDAPLATGQPRPVKLSKPFA